jgi:hypothetical protein
VTLYIDLRTQLNGYNNRNVGATMSTLSKRGWTSPDTLHRALNELSPAELLEPDVVERLAASVQLSSVE